MKVGTVLVTVFAFVACSGGGSSNDLNEDEAAQAFGVAFAVAFQALGEANLAAVEPVAAAHAEGPALGTVVDVCPDGGNIEVMGNSTLEDFDVDMDFNDCGTQNVTIDGSISFSGSVNGNVVEFSMEGDLEFSGDLDGDCEIDITATVNTATNAQSIDGEFCGQNI